MVVLGAMFDSLPVSAACNVRHKKCQQKGPTRTSFLQSPPQVSCRRLAIDNNLLALVGHRPFRHKWLLRRPHAAATRLISAARMPSPQQPGRRARARPADPHLSPQNNMKTNLVLTICEGGGSWSLSEALQCESAPVL